MTAPTPTSWCFPVSIPKGSIKSHGRRHGHHAHRRFQFQKVRLKEADHPQRAPAVQQFQFQKVRLKARLPGDEQLPHRRFNSKRFD